MCIEVLPFYYTFVQPKVPTCEGSLWMIELVRNSSKGFLNKKCIQIDLIERFKTKS